MNGDGVGVHATALGTNTAGILEGSGSLGRARRAAGAIVSSGRGCEQALAEAVPLLSVAGEADVGA